MKTVTALLLFIACLLFAQANLAWAQLTVHAMIKTSDADPGAHLQQAGAGTPPLANLNINGSYPQGCTGAACVFTITPRVGAAATVFALDDAVDTIQLKDTVITASKAGVYGTIYFWADFINPPATGPKVRITTTADGTILRGACGARGDKIMAASGYVQDPTGAGGSDGISGSWIWIDSNSSVENKTISGPALPPCLPVANGSFSLTDNVLFSTGLQGQRIMKGYVKFYLSTAGDKLTFSASGVRLQTGPEAGGGGSEPPGPVEADSPSCPSGQECTPKSQLNTFCMTTYSTLKTFGCPNCISEDGMPTASGKVTLFASNNWENLEQDLARGSGESIASLATLLNVPTMQHPTFITRAQEQYRALAQVGPPTPETLVASLRRPIMMWQTVADQHSQP
jgi:hypothetical protein